MTPQSIKDFWNNYEAGLRMLGTLNDTDIAGRLLAFMAGVSSVAAILRHLIKDAQTRGEIND